MRFLTLCADDFAYRPQISAGIIELARNNRINATSVMSLSPFWPEHAAQLRELKNKLSVGLHIDLTSEFAIHTGLTASLPMAMFKSLLHLWSTADIKRSIEQQLNSFEACWQSAPDHIDGHQHIQQFPQWRDALFEVLYQRYTNHKPWLRISKVLQSGFKPCLITAMGANALQSRASQLAWPVRSPLSGVYDFKGNINTYRLQMQNWLANLPRHNQSVLMCHPALPADGFKPESMHANHYDPLQASRSWEFLYLNSTDFCNDLELADTSLDPVYSTTVCQ